MAFNPDRIGLELTEDEALALLSLCMMSPEKLDATSEKALRKLADYCKARTFGNSTHTPPAQCELYEAS